MKGTIKSVELVRQEIIDGIYRKINNDLPRDDYQEFVRNFKIRHDM